MPERPYLHFDMLQNKERWGKGEREREKLKEGRKEGRKGLCFLTAAWSSRMHF
jgi:hypothetical protein